MLLPDKASDDRLPGVQSENLDDDIRNQEKIKKNHVEYLSSPFFLFAVAYNAVVWLKRCAGSEVCRWPAIVPNPTCITMTMMGIYSSRLPALQENGSDSGAGLLRTSSNPGSYYSKGEYG
jgi:hypothetical protein